MSPLETRVAELEKQLALLRRELNRQPANPARPIGRRAGAWFGRFTTAVNQGSTGTFEPIVRDGGAWVLSGLSLTVTDFFLQTGESIPDDAKGYVVWFQQAGVFVPVVWTCEASDTLPE